MWRCITRTCCRPCRHADAAFDVIFSGFAVHHLDAAAKQELFHACAAKLAPGGRFILVDVVREEGQTREQYLEGYLNFMRTQWTAVRPIISKKPALTSPRTTSPRRSPISSAWPQRLLGETRLLDRFAQHHVLVFSA
jgi:SAM-dependent methyltransferase